MVFVLALLLSGGSLFADSVVTGRVLEQDGVSPIEGAVVTFEGYSVEGDTLVYDFISDTLGVYEAQLVPGTYWVSAFVSGYEPAFLPDSLWVEEDQMYEDFDFILQEVAVPVRYVAARHFYNDMVRVSWSMHDPRLFEDFETGDFSLFNWDNTISPFPWAIDSVHAQQGNYCMKSTCEGQDEGQSEIEVAVYVPWQGQMAFHSKISSENPWDAGLFYIDGVKMLECSGMVDWEEHRFQVGEGEHVFRWAYHKDASTDVGDDCFYVDNIRFYVEDTLKGDDDRSFQYYDLFRRRYDGETVMLASHLTDTVFMEMNWSGLPWGKYCWGISCYYEGNRVSSDTTWSCFLDKDMTTSFELVVTTNVGLSAAGAAVTLASEGEAGHSYQGTVDAEGVVQLTDVYRDLYSLQVTLDGFVDYASDSLISIMEPVHHEIELREALKGVDSLYVSSTGWAMWRLSDTLYRGLQYFEIRLDSVLVASTTESFFQFEVGQLVGGMTYQAQVRPVYLSDTCGWYSYSWTYRPCSDFQGTTAGVHGTLYDDAVSLSWVYPENDTVMGAMLYRDGLFFAFVEGDRYVDEDVVNQGSVEYCLRVVHDGALDGTCYSMSCYECVTITFPSYCDPPVKLDAENYLDGEADFGALISWGERPEPVQSWLHYDDGQFKNSVGGGDEPVIFWSIRFDAEDLLEYQGTTLQKVSLFDVGAGSYQLWIYKGGDDAPQTLLFHQNMDLAGIQAWHEESVVSSVEIPENEPLWIVVGQQGLRRPAAVCSDMGDANGRWVSLDGSEWHDLHHYNMYYTWMLRAYVTNRLGKTMPLGNDGFVLQNFNLYRSYNHIDYQQIAAIPFVEGQEFYQYRDMLVGTSHHEFYYRLTAVYLSDEGETCESDFAASLNHPEDNYVWVDDHWNLTENQETKLIVYPNPATDLLHIEAKDVCRLSVFNALGQCVISEKVAKDETQLDFSDLPNGLYLLKVETKNGVASRRFVVAH